MKLISFDDGAALIVPAFSTRAKVTSDVLSLGNNDSIWDNAAFSEAELLS